MVASFTQTLNTYIVNFAAVNGTVDVQSVVGVPYGSEISFEGQTATVNGTKVTATQTADDDQYDYEFVEWTVTDDATTTGTATTITAVYSQTVKRTS